MSEIKFTDRTSSVSKEIKFNINSYVKLKLTECGIVILKEYVNECCLRVPKELRDGIRFLYRINANGYIKLQLHEAMRVFGNYMIPNQEPFSTEIVLEEVI